MKIENEAENHRKVYRQTPLSLIKFPIKLRRDFPAIRPDRNAIFIANKAAIFVQFSCDPVLRLVKISKTKTSAHIDFA